MRLLVCGSRTYRDYENILTCLTRKIAQLDRAGDAIECIIEGGAKGADKLAKKAAKLLDIPVIEFEAEWDKYGKRAEPIRNAEMLREGKPDIVMAFCVGAVLTRGTADMVRRAEQVGIPTEIYYST